MRKKKKKKKKKKKNGIFFSHWIELDCWGKDYSFDKRFILNHDRTLQIKFVSLMKKWISERCWTQSKQNEWMKNFPEIRFSCLCFSKQVQHWFLFSIHPLTFMTLRAMIQQTTNWWYFSYFSQKTEFDISCKLSPLETICMKCQILFSGKNKKNISKCC